jgi:hypothetical protein
LRPRRGDAPNEAGVIRRRGNGEAPAQDRERWPDGLDGEGEEIRSQNDDSLRPLARALLALSEQLSREEGP